MAIKKTIIIMFLISNMLLLYSCGTKGEEMTKIEAVKYPTVKEAEGYLKNRVIGDAQFDFELAKQKGLTKSDGFSEKYLYLQELYKAGFNEMLNVDNLLNSFDEKLKKDKRKFTPSAKMDIYQKYGSFGRTFIYIRNDFSIERLSAEDLELLESKKKIDDKKLLKLVKDTYKSVITPLDASGEPMEGSEVIIYDETIAGAKKATADGAILQITYAPSYDKEGNYIDAAAEKTKNEDLKKWASTLEDELSEQTQNSVFVFIELRAS
jgi:hypothetical protein